MILLNMARGDPLYCDSVIAELPYKEAATLTWSLRIPGSGGSFMLPRQLRIALAAYPFRYFFQRMVNIG